MNEKPLKNGNVRRASRQAGRPNVNQRINASGTVSWCVDLGSVNGKRKRLFFKTKQEADNHADQAKIAKINQGTAAFSLTDKQRIDALEAYARLEKLNANLLDAVEYFSKHARPGKPKKVKEISVEFLKVKKESNRRPIYLSNLKYMFNAFEKVFADRFIHEIGHGEIQDWLTLLSLSQRSKANYYNDLRNLFGYAVRQNHCASNVLERLEKPTPEEKEIGILTVKQAGDLLAVADQQSDGEMLPFVALGLFAGLRREEIRRLDWANVNLKEKFVEITAKTSKTRERRIVDLSKNAIAWLRPYQKRTGLIAPKDAPYRLEKLARLATITPFPRNGLRHSFASYLFAKKQNAATVAAQLGHTNLRTLYTNYREIVRPKSANAYWLIMPCREQEKTIIQFKQEAA